MDDSEKMVVDFVLPAEFETVGETSTQGARASRPGKCTACGGNSHTLVSKMGGDAAKGIPASHMYECADCGTYRLG